MEQSQSAAFLLSLALLYISITLTLGRPPVRRVVKVAWQAFFNESFRSEELFQRLHVQWVDLWKGWAAIFATLTECYAVLVLCLRLGGAEESEKPPWEDLHIWFVLILLLALSCSCRPTARMDAMESRKFTIIVNVASVLTRADTPKQLLPTNTVASMMMSFIAAEPVFSVWVRVVLIPVSVAIDWSQEALGAGSKELALIVANELISSLFISCMLLQADFLMRKREAAAIDLEAQMKKSSDDAKEIQQILAAARRLLSVTCDCCEQLSNNWDLLNPTRRAMELLQLPPTQPEQVETALPFLQFICDEDQERFVEFTKTSKDSEAASSLHLRMKNFHGTAFDAQLYYVSVPGLLHEKPQHLIGIATSVPTEPSVCSIPEDEVLDSETIHWPTSRSAPAFTSSVRRRRPRSSEGSSSGSSSQPQQQFPGWQLIPSLAEGLQEVSHVGLVLDLSTGAEGFAVRCMEVTFKAQAVVDKLPKLFSWVTKRHRPTVEDWIQEHLNAWYHRETSDEHCPGVKFRIPGIGAGFTAGEMVMREILCPEPDSGADVEDYELLMRVELRPLIAC